MPDMDGGALPATLQEDRTTIAVPLIFLSGLVSPTESAQGNVGGWPMLSTRSPVEQVVKKIDELLEKKTK